MRHFVILNPIKLGWRITWPYTLKNVLFVEYKCDKRWKNVKTKTAAILLCLRIRQKRLLNHCKMQNNPTKRLKW